MVVQPGFLPQRCHFCVYFHKWFTICFADFTYWGPSLSNMLFHPRPGNGRMEEGRRKQFYILSFSFQSLSGQVGDLHEARSSHGCAPYISPEVYRVVYQPRGFPLFLIPSPAQIFLRISAQRFSTVPNSISCKNIISPEVFHFS